MKFTDNALRSRFLSACEGVTSGIVVIKTPEGETHRFGSSGEEAVLEIHDWAVVSAMAARGQIGLGETYVNGLWDTPSIESIIRIGLSNRDTFSDFDDATWFNSLKYQIIDRVLRANSKSGSQKNIYEHYDVGNEFYQLWLDETMMYSSGIYNDPGDDLTAAQYRKNDRALSRLTDKEGILEIGCGWGGFAERAADQGRHVTGITVSKAQRSYADARLDGRSDIQLCDYRDVKGKFDNIVSIEMIEAVGQRYWPSYFSAIKENLAEGGRALLQAITVPDNSFDYYAKGSDYIRQHVFPGGLLLSSAHIAQQAKNVGLTVKDNFEFGQSYALTCRTWSERLAAKTSKIKSLGYDDPFLRHWKFYLDICAAAFSVGHTQVVQVELAHAENA